MGTRKITVPCQLDSCVASSYIANYDEKSKDAMVPGDEVNVCTAGSKLSVKDRHVIIVEDIVDTGRTLSSLKDALISNGALTVKVATLLDKPDGRKKDYMDQKPEYTAFVIPELFVVGYGLDYNHALRHLPYVGIMKPPTTE